MNFTDFHFLRPLWWLALLPTFVLLLSLVRHKQGRGNWAEVCDAELLPFLLQDTPLTQRRYGLFGGALASLLVITALAGPTWERLPSPAFRNDSALVIALDLSKSMDAADIKPSRIAKARYKIADLLKQRKDGQTALLIYGGDAFTVTPLTNDNATIDSQLTALTTDIMPSPGSNTQIAIEKSAALLRQAGLTQGHILLVTDGVDAESVDQADNLLGEYRLSVLGVGTAEGAPIQQAGNGFLKDAAGNIILAKLNESDLATLARAGRGDYQRITADDDDVDHLSRLFNSVIAANNPNQESNLLLQQWDEKGPWLLLLILPWAALQFRKGLLCWGLLCLLPIPQDSYAFEWQNLWKTPNQQAQQAFNQQQYQQAAEQFDDPNWRAAAQYKAGQYQQAAETLKDVNSSEGFYNRANALAQAGQLEEAVQAYQQALKLDPKHQDAQYNKELVEKKLKEQQQKPQQQPPQSSPDQQKQQDKQGENKDQNKQDSDAKSDQKPSSPQENPKEQKDQQASKADQSPQPADADDKPASEAEQQQPKNDQEASQQPPQTATATEKDEAERANEQLLKRIPDEPTGLLKRKFKYQYRQRNQPEHSGPDW